MEATSSFFRDHIFRPAPRDRAFSAPFRQPNVAWPLIAAKLWLIAAFVGVSLMVIVAEVWLWDNGAQPASKLALMLFAGAAIVALACRKLTPNSVRNGLRAIATDATRLRDRKARDRGLPFARSALRSNSSAVSQRTDTADGP